MAALRNAVYVLSAIPNLAAELRASLPKVQVINVELPGKAEELQNVEVMFADLGLLGPIMYSMPRLRWVQSTSAGSDKLFKHYNKDQVSPSFTLTKYASSFFSQMMAEYVISQVIAHERKFPSCHLRQAEKVFAIQEFETYRTLQELSVGMLGAGSMGKEVARAFKFFGSKVSLVSRRKVEDEVKLPFIDEYRLASDLPDFLRQCDVICSILPSTGDTRNLLGGGMLKNCADRNPVFVNVGRGDVILESDLVMALDKKWISHAILDVFEIEPLPADSRLWTHPQVTITPHVSAISYTRDLVKCFIENFHRFEAGEALNNVVDWDSGY